MRRQVALMLFSFFLNVNTDQLAVIDESSGSDPDFVQHIIDRHRIPHFLFQKANQLAGNSKTEVDHEEVLNLEMTVPEYAQQQYLKQIYDEDEALPLQTTIDNFQNVIFYTFRAFGCVEEDIWPSVYNFSRADVQCISNKLLMKVYRKSSFTQKYLARAIHFGLISRAPIDHRITEMLVYQHILPKRDYAWFKTLKTTFKNSIWNSDEANRYEEYKRDSLGCAEIEFNQEVRKDIDEYFNTF